MTSTRKASWRYVVAVSATLVGLAIALLAAFATAEPVASKSSGEACPGADTLSVDTTVKALRTSLRCRINEERAIHGTGRLLIDRSLRTAATRHVKTMVATDCLAHKCPGEPNLDTRIRNSGYADGADSYQYAENTGCGQSADAMVEVWLDSTFHRLNLLDESYEDIGVGVSQETIKGRCGKGFATFAVVFGHREP